MPLWNEHSPSFEWTDPDLVPRPVVSIGATGIVMESLDRQDADFRHQPAIDFHRHLKGELLLALRGVMTCEVENGFWIVPPQSAIWVPGGVEHKFTTTGLLECYVVFIDPHAALKLPLTCCSLSTTPLLRELMVRSASLPMLYAEGGMESHLMTLLLDEIALQQVGNLHLPMPTDVRLRKIVDMIMDDPADRGTIQTWARRVGMSERTLARLLVHETGMSFGRWRQQLHLMLAVRWLGAGSSVQQVSDALGYESASSFVTMFRKNLGAPPGRYMAERKPAA
ncbi:transcriptional regulator [Acetobacter orleanensis NRIC 0473]|uniref:AraC family transcriptional regulator n=2 Tax=Acetobacter orleanensis TaxID=104099 RepID=A0A4Y3TM69_9PROT|nr:AraC family transcriptional regulator [Acetobacter orleanensis]PCD80768.1 AraC family transcriptional regulator [Acetobacter orleanensis]GAN68018.1 transcriptional regulator AraC [Acetobacter orleanensis JCM 7639]GBR27326.1 transcriptional regulator [Acetobacter orleanensis NRIC 0473]GEB82060.1 AraC family transcriptional regulator [Acetobacter orleanensis]